MRNIFIQRNGRIVKNPFGYLRSPARFVKLGGDYPESVKNYCGKVTDIRHTYLAVFNIFSGSRKRDVFFSVCPAAVRACAVSRIRASVIGNDNKEGVVNDFRLFCGVVNIINKFIDFGYAIEMRFCAVTVPMSGAVNAVKLNKKEIGLFIDDIIADLQQAFDAVKE